MEHKTVISGIYFVAISGFESFFGLRNSFQSYVSLGKYFSGIFPRVSSSSINLQRKHTQEITLIIKNALLTLEDQPNDLFFWLKCENPDRGANEPLRRGTRKWFPSEMGTIHGKILPFPVNTQKVILTQCAHCPEATLPAWGVDSTGWHHELFFIRELSI